MTRRNRAMLLMVVVSTAAAWAISCSSEESASARCKRLLPVSGTSTLAPEECVRDLFPGGKLRFPRVSDYQRPNFGITDQDPLSIEAQYPPIHKDQDPAILFDATVAQPGDKIEATAFVQVNGDTPRLLQINGLDVRIDGALPFRNASWIYEGVVYHLAVTHEDWTVSQLDARLESLVADMTAPA